MPYVHVRKSESQLVEGVPIMSMEHSTTVMPVAQRHRFDVDALERYLQRHVEGYTGPLEVEQFSRGQSNPTYRLTAGSRRYVLRRKPPGKLLPSAHAVDREYRVMTALRDTGVPVPRTYALCEDDSIIGTAFFVMEYVEGRILWDPWLPDVVLEERPHIYGEMARVMALLHQVDYKEIGLESYGRPGGYFQRQVGRWSKQYRASETRTIDAMERLMEWLPQNVPDGDESAIAHGDFRPANLIFHPTEPRILAVLDWELSTIGHPLGDFGYQCMAYRLPRSLDGLRDFDLREINIPTEAEQVADYAKRTGRGDVPNWDYYVIFNLFRLAAIKQGILGRALEGTAKDEGAKEFGEQAGAVADVAWQEVETMLAGR